jgi:hypothetical protein
VIAMTLAYLAEATELTADKRRGHMQKVDRSVARMIALLDDVADAWHLMRGEPALAMEPVRASVVLDEAVREARPSIEGRGVAVSWTAPEGLSVRVDRARAVRAIGSVIQRVAATAPRGGAVRVEAREGGDDVVVDVQGGVPLPVGRGAAFSLEVAARIVSAQGGKAGTPDDLERNGAVRLTLPKALPVAG